MSRQAKIQRKTKETEIDLALDLVGGGDSETKERAVLDKVDETDEVGAALFAGALLGGPSLDERGKRLVQGDVGLAWLAAEGSGSGCELGVEGVKHGI